MAVLGRWPKRRSRMINAAVPFAPDVFYVCAGCRRRIYVVRDPGRSGRGGRLVCSRCFKKGKR